MQKKRAILLVGPTGCGKTPLGELLERRGLWGRRCRHFDFGARLRRLPQAQEVPGCLTPQEVDCVEDALASGALLEDEHFRIAEAMLRAFIAEHNVADDDYAVLNGLPRHVGQARDVAAIVDVQTVIELSCTPEVVPQRLRSNAGGDRTARTDDDGGLVRQKLETYAARTAPLIDYYARAGARMETVDVRADARAEDIWQALMERGAHSPRKRGA